MSNPRYSQEFNAEAIRQVSTIKYVTSKEGDT